MGLLDKTFPLETDKDNNLIIHTINAKHNGVYCPPKFGPLPKPRLWYNIHDLKGGPDGETKTKKLHP